jgi:hypothetical protein
MGQSEPYRYCDLFVGNNPRVVCRLIFPEDVICTIYNMSGRVLSDIQTRAEKMT